MYKECTKEQPHISTTDMCGCSFITPSLVDSAAVVAGALVADLAVAAAAEVAGAGTRPIAIEGQGYEGEAYRQREQCRQEREDEIDDHADGQQREQIE